MLLVSSCEFDIRVMLKNVWNVMVVNSSSSCIGYGGWCGFGLILISMFVNRYFMSRKCRCISMWFVCVCRVSLNSGE